MKPVLSICVDEDTTRLHVKFGLLIPLGSGVVNLLSWGTETSVWVSLEPCWLSQLLRLYSCV